MMKSDPQITQRINQTIQDLQRRYFSEVSAMIQSTLALESPEFLYDEGFIGYFFNLVQRLRIAEYYYVEDPDGFLLVSDTGHLSRLIVHGDRELQGSLFSLKRHRAPAHIIKRVASGKALPWLWSTPDDYDEDDEFVWAEHIHEAERIDGDMSWFCALVENPPADIEYDSGTSSYLAYLESLEKHH